MVQNLKKYILTSVDFPPKILAENPLAKQLVMASPQKSVSCVLKLEYQK